MSLPDISEWEHSHPLSGNRCPVTGAIPIVADGWMVETAGYRLRTGVLEPGVVLSLPVGYTTVENAAAFFENLEAICASHAIDRNNFVVVEDYTLHTGADYESRIRYINGMIEKIRPRAIIFITRSYYWKLNIRLGMALGRWSIDARIASDYEQALALAAGFLGRPLSVRESYTPQAAQDADGETFRPRTSVYLPMEAPIEDDQISDILRIISAIQWEDFGFKPEVNRTCDPEFDRLLIALGSLKQDIDEVLTNREEELAEVEAANIRAELLSRQIEKELEDAREAERTARWLAKENQGLIGDINLSQKEIFIVLADDVDVRSGARAGYTVALARQVARIASVLRLPSEEVRDMYDATLLHHIGFLGIPDHSNWLAEEHCIVGQEVLARLPGNVARIARDMAGCHHECFDGSGFPFRLQGDEIPLPARLLRIATQICEFGGKLSDMAGRELDPDLVAAVESAEQI
jgi:HD-GYP domain-containing protein (c-di-GMP phosphodiesterase class II)